MFSWRHDTQGHRYALWRYTSPFHMKTRVFFNVDLPTTRYLAFASIWEALLWRLIDTVALNWCPYPCDKSKYICFYSRNPRRSIRSFFLGTSPFIRVTLPPSPCAHEAQLGVVAWPAQILLAVVPKADCETLIKGLPSQRFPHAYSGLLLQMITLILSAFTLTRLLFLRHLKYTTPKKS